MTDLAGPDAPPRPAPDDRPGFLARLALSPRIHALAERLPGLRALSRREGRALFGLLSGFAQTQILTALVESGVMERLRTQTLSTEAVAAEAGIGRDAALLMMQGAAALRLVRRTRSGVWSLSTRGAALLAVPGLAGMIAHNRVLYRDLADPLAFLRGETRPEMAAFWPYVFGAGAAEDPARAARYSVLMADSQALVAADTLAAIDLRGIRHLMDVGGGTGAFLSAVARRAPELALTLFDLPAVLGAASDRLGAEGTGSRIMLCAGSFRDDPLPTGADAISLVRVLYDHADATVASLLAAVHAALPPGGRLIVSEPMSGGDRPDPATDVYFALYTRAMGTGRTRSAARIAALMDAAGFGTIRVHPAARPFVTQVVTARKA